jgi:hypothetical protein
MTPGIASKLNGQVAFTETGMFSRVGRAAARAIRQREYSDRPPWNNSWMLRRALLFLRMLFEFRPRRTLMLRPPVIPPLVIASDAQYTPTPGGPGSASGAFLVVDVLSNQRYGAYLKFSLDDLSALGFSALDLENGANPIAPCEAVMVALALLEVSKARQHREVLFCIDNSVALYSMVKGGSAQPIVDRASQIVHISNYWDNSNVWFEFVSSECNWSDGASRNLGDDKFAAANGFSLKPLNLNQDLWQTPIDSLWEKIRESSGGSQPE